MRKILHSIAILLLTSISLFGQGKLIISEVADPKDDSNARFVELYNIGDAAIDFSTDIYFLSKQSNGGSWTNIPLTGTIAAGATYIVAYQLAAFEAQYGFAANIYSGNISGNGDDGYFLYKDADQATGTLIDAYGVINEDGTGKPWEYEDDRAVRVGGMVNPNATWTASEWMITLTVNKADFDPGVHSNAYVADVTAPIWTLNYPQVKNIIANSFDLLTKLDEGSTCYYVVLEGGATAPSVAEVLAGTGAAAAVPVKAGSFASGTAESMLTIDGLTVDVTYDIYVVAQDDETVPNVQAEVSKLTVTTATPPDVLLNADFEVDLTPFTAVSIVGAQVWAQSSYSGNGYAKVSGYSSGNKDNEDWLISAAIDLDASTENVLSFLTAANFTGPDLGVFISTDFSGTYDSASVVTASWTNITSQVTLSAGAYAWTESGDVDLTTYSGMIYVGFKYLSNTVDTAKTYEVDDFKIKGYLKPGSDASLSDLSIDAATITGFDAAKLSYTLELPMGTTAIPVVTYTTTDAAATSVISSSTDLAGDNAARTTTIIVTAQDGTTIQTYTVLFNPILEAATISVFRNGDATRKYIITGEVLLSYKNASRGQKYLQDATGGIMIDDYSSVITTNYEIGDKIKNLTGTKLVYNGLVEFIPLQDPGPAVSSGNAVEPVEITMDQFNNELNSYESKLVTIKNAVFADAGATFASKTNYNFTVGEATGVLRTNYADLEYIGAAIPGKADITGVVIQYKGLAQIIPRANADFRIISANANLIELKVNAVAVAGFDLAVLNYAVTLPVGTSAIPAITYTTANVNASVVVTNPTNLFGTEAERTASIEVTAENGTTVKTYTVVFTVDNTGVNYNAGAKLNLYPVPAYNEITISGLAKVNKLELMDITGKVLRKIDVTADEVTVNISELQKGLYFLRTESQTLKFVKK